MDVPAWIPVTLAAAVFQAWRTALQAKLRHELSAGGAAFVRYLYALPLDLAMLALAWLWFRPEGVTLTTSFWLFCLAGGISQIFGTFFLISAFHHRNFVVGTAYAKTEAVQLVLISVLIVGVTLPPLAIVGAFVAVTGAIWLSIPIGQFTLRGWLHASLQPAALFGLAAGLGFALTALALREASLTLNADLPVLLKALLVLLATNVLQTVIQGGYMARFERPQLRRCLTHWRAAYPVGVLSALGSAAWFTGFSLTQVALVRGLGQIEIVFTLLFGHFFLKERYRRGEALGLILVATGVLTIALAELH